MNEAQIIKTACVLSLLLGSLLQIYCFSITLRFGRNLSAGKIRNQLIWPVLFTGLFSVLYLIFALYSTYADDTQLILLASAILFLVAFFVMIVCRSLTEAYDVILTTEVMDRQRISDEAMGIYNRGYFDLRLREVMALARRHRQIFSVLLLEIDYLDEITRSYGVVHTSNFFSGLGKLIKTSIRETDIVARYSKDEIVIMLPNTELVGARAVVTKIRAAVENEAFYVDDTGEINQAMIACTVSIGVAVYTDEIKTSDEIMRRADVALFKAKDKGRNQAAFYGE